jgi:hypothetical protein
MKLLALVTPCAVLAVLWALQRLEVWMDEASGPRGRPRTPAVARQRAEPPRRGARAVRRG